MAEWIRPKMDCKAIDDAKYFFWFNNYQYYIINQMCTKQRYIRKINIRRFLKIELHNFFTSNFLAHSVNVTSNNSLRIFWNCFRVCYINVMAMSVLVMRAY